MRVAIVTPRLVRNDGQGRVNLEIVKPLLDDGAHVTALTSAIEPELRTYTNFRWIRTGLLSVPTSLLRMQLFSLQSFIWLSRHKNEFDLIQADGSVTLFPSDVNSCHFVHGAWSRSEAHTSRYNRNAYGLYHHLLTMLDCAQERIAFSRASHIVAVSNQVKEQLMQIGISESKIRVIWNGIDVNEFAPGVARRATFGIPDGVFVAMFAGDMKTPRKNLDTILRALCLMPDVHLVVAGEYRGTSYQAQVQKFGLERRVHFLGFRRDLADVMKSVDAFVYPARYEPLGLVVLEALASGLPVVTARTTGASQLIGDDCGFVIDNPNDAEALAAALRPLVDDRELRAKMGASARDLALEHTWSFMAREYSDLYHRIATIPTHAHAARKDSLEFQ